MEPDDHEPDISADPEMTRAEEIRETGYDAVENSEFSVLAIGLFVPAFFIYILLMMLGLESRWLAFGLASMPLLAMKAYPYWILHRSRRPLRTTWGERIGGKRKRELLLIAAITAVLLFAAPSIIFRMAQGGW